MENITKYEDSQNMTQFILKKIKKIHGHFNKDYVMGFSLLENLSRGPVSAAFALIILMVSLVLQMCHYFPTFYHSIAYFTFRI